MERRPCFWWAHTKASKLTSRRTPNRRLGFRFQGVELPGSNASGLGFFGLGLRI